MVLRKERSFSEVGNEKNLKMSSNEQPVIKRQKIDNDSDSELENNVHPDFNSDQICNFENENHRTSEVIDYRSEKILNCPSNYCNASSTTSHVTIESQSSNDMIIFQEYLLRQCLCAASEQALRKPFQSHFNHDINGSKRIATLSEWPNFKLFQFLSNVQLLFDVYLKQNQQGQICARIMDVCDALLRNEHNLIDEIIDLCEHSNKYVNYLAGKVLSSFLVISKDNMNTNWLKRIVDNLFHFEHLDFLAVKKISFSLDIIKRIIEWKDIEVHPLGEAVSHQHVNTSNSNDQLHLHLPTIENNYFAQYYIENENSNNVPSNHNNRSIKQTKTIVNEIDNNSQHTSSISSLNLPSTSKENSNSSNVRNHLNCQVITLTDSESFDTTHLKCITIKILENKWPALVKNMSTLILSHRNMNTTENCISTFLALWENIISVRANLSIVETLPFYAQLDKFELLLNQNLSSTVYKQMLTLFNEALCYGSTLALQDLLPDETCSLAHQIVRHVKDFRILDSLPRRQPENPVSLIEFFGNSVNYEYDTFCVIENIEKSNMESVNMDKTLLQKMVLLVLKSVAVTVKEIRSDSSDSSIDSSDYEAFQDMVLIERSIRDVLKKLESFIKNTLEFHPESHFSKILIHLFDDQDDYLIEAMVCTLDVTVGISFRNNAFPELVTMLNPVYTFLEFSKMISNSSELLLDLLVSNETCFLLYLLRFLKYIRLNWSMFVQSCEDFGMGNNTLDSSLSVLIRLRLQISRLVSKSLFPYDISPILRLLESCENLYEGNELS